MFVVRDGVAAHAAGHRRHPRGRDPAGRSWSSPATLGIPVEVRSIDRSEIYIADEMFLCGTGVQMSPVVELDHRPIGSRRGRPDQPAARPRRYFAAVRGHDPRFAHWLTPITQR